MCGHPFSLLVSVQCSAGGCLIELAQQLAVIMIGKQIINNAQEILVPKMKAWWQKRQVNIGHTQTEENQDLLSSSLYCIKWLDELETVWKEALVAYLKILSPLTEGKTQKPLVGTVGMSFNCVQLCVRGHNSPKLDKVQHTVNSLPH
jgi:hypothetical protein